jgi:ATP/maltotriose-dependent transcriptional regulator MalT
MLAVEQPWLAQTKLHPPEPCAEVLERPFLLGQLYRAVTTRRLTLLSVPAGAGKTTALAALHRARPDWPLAWLTLDPAGDDATSFFSPFLAALWQLEPKYVANTSALRPSRKAAW